MEYIEDIIKGLVIGILYLFITKENDTSFRNLGVFSLFYFTVANGAKVIGVDSTVIITAFITKSVFTFVDQRIKINKDKKDK